MRRRPALLALALASLTPLVLAAPGASADTAGAVPDPTFRAVSGVTSPDPRVPPVAGPRPLHPVALARAKTAAAARAHVPVRISGTPGTAPVSGLGWNGQSDPRLTPPDTTGAIGPSSYIQLVNLQYGIYDRTSGATLAQGDLAGFTGIPDSDVGPCLTDPQIIWDPDGGRFYYVALDVCADMFAFGFSRGAAPTAAGDADWCRYEGFDYGLSIPDFPKLGDSSQFILIGTNVFLLGAFYQGSDVDWIDKATLALGVDGSCPAPEGIGAGVFQTLKNADGTDASTPVPANGVDTSATAFVMAGPDASSSPGEEASTLSVFRVTRDGGTGGAVISAPKTLAVPTYSVPAAAIQRGTGKTLDTSDARLTQAVAAIDPNRGANGKMAVWTQHTVFGGGGAQARWYEVDPGSATGQPKLFQKGTVSRANGFVFNASISPDRRVGAGGSAFGGNMVMTFSTSSSTAFPAIQMVSKVGGAARSPLVLVQQSPGRSIDGSCGPVCRWGDYSGASPDPAAPLGGTTGRVWLTNQWNVKSLTSGDVDWRTKIWSATP